MNDKNQILVGGAPEGFDAQLVIKEFRDKCLPVVHIARDDKRLAEMSEALLFFDPRLTILCFPGWDCQPYDRISPKAEISAERMYILSRLVSERPKNFILLTTVNSITQRVPCREFIKKSSFEIVVGKRLDEGKLYEYLSDTGFQKVAKVSEAGEFAVRGGIIDIFSAGDKSPIRLDLFGDILDSVGRFDPISQMTTEKLETVELLPVSEVAIDDHSISLFRKKFRTEFGGAFVDEPVYEAVSSGKSFQGLEHWLPFFYEGLETLFDYIPDGIVTLDNQVFEVSESRWDSIRNQYETRKIVSNQNYKLGAGNNPVNPELLYINNKEFQHLVNKRRCLQFSPFRQRTGSGTIDAGGRVGRNFVVERKQKEKSLFSSLIEYIDSRKSISPIVIASYSDGARDRLHNLIKDEGFSDINFISSAAEILDKGLYLVVWALESGFQSKTLTVISEQDVLGERLVRKAQKSRKAENFLTEANSLTRGDLVVHIDHGVARFNGLEVINAAGAAHECLALEYAEKARLYLPVENIELLSKYGQQTVELDRLGGAAWQSKKASLKKRIKEIAGQLIRIAAERELSSAPVIQPPREIWDSFNSRFPYEETEDQLNAIQDVLNDLKSGIPMDRLICGDVGYGKTEIAMRAAFATAMSGIQVAIIVPTTLLARQHLKSFSSRFFGFPLKIKQLSRFVSLKEAKTVRDGLKNGSVDIIIGTHALLGKEIMFKNLGLLIIDEEQHFGVKHKEKLKNFRSEIHVLTLTATPIPRTLQLSLSGIRDMSLITTPPIDRLSIQTYVGEFDIITIREALQREKTRGGNSFFVVPRLKDLPEIENFLKEQVPELNYVVAHGQMAPRLLDERMNYFYEGKFDILLTTNIVESGLDIPTANTIVIYRADMFGLGQLYQLRGRVGRAKIRAFAHLVINSRKKLTVPALKRLKVLGSLDKLGAGFSLASQDLDIRGAGNILGEAQSGQIREVGYELYQTMLEEAVAQMKTAFSGKEYQKNDKWVPQINLGVPVLIPDFYISDIDIRLGLYKRLSNLTTKVELEGFAAELIDRFGKLPKEINILLLVIQIKSMCKKSGVAKLDGGPKGVTIQFYRDKFVSPQGLIEYLKKENGLAKIKANKLIVRRNWRRDSDRIKGAFAITKELAQIVKNSCRDR